MSQGTGTAFRVSLIGKGGDETLQTWPRLHRLEPSVWDSGSAARGPEEAGTGKSGGPGTLWGGFDCLRRRHLFL